MSESRIPGWLWVTTPACAIAFAGFLIYLNTQPSSDEMEAVQGDARSVLQQGIDRARDKVAEKAAESMGEESQAAYDFYKLLEEQKVEAPKVEAYKSTPKGAAIQYQYILQAGSFRNSEDADRMRANLLLLGLDAYQQASDNGNGVWNRVYVGPFTNRSKLNKAMDILVSNNISPLTLKRPLPTASSDN